ncbi:hypothetical protein TNCV_3131901, partial [Trichonephila clavipes]
QTQLLPSISSKTSTTSDPQPPTPISKIKREKLKNIHHYIVPEKDNIKNRLNAHKFLSNLKKIPKTSVKNAREQDSPNETTPEISKNLGDGKLFKVSDAMRQTNPSDTDYVTGLASEKMRAF